MDEKKYFLMLAKGELEGAALYEKVAGFVEKRIRPGDASQRSRGRRRATRRYFPPTRAKRRA